MNYHRQILTSLDRKNVYIRHDIDDNRDLCNAQKLAGFEWLCHLRSTFYTKTETITIDLPTHRNCLNTLQDAGFGIGLHIDINRFRPSGKAISANILRQLILFYSFSMTTCTGHSGTQYEIWNDYNPNINEGIGYTGRKFDLATFGFTRDVSMLLPNEFYLGDSMGRWAYRTPDMGIPIPYEGDLPTIENPMEVIEEWKKTDTMLQVLIHPQYFS